jgi:hypothetical protein
MWRYNRTDKGEERVSVSPFFFFDLWTWAVEHSVEMVRPRGMAWHRMTCGMITIHGLITV